MVCKFRIGNVTEPVIQVEHLSKKYVLGHQQPGQYKTLRESIIQRAQSALKPLLQPGHHPASGRVDTDFWALKDVSFEINQGDRIGIIGRNGAGKSTLLKILSRITEPTAGRIVMEGKTASLLEVGTGFHPELTGRENIFLNGAVLGMTKAEIRRKFDEIVAFAEVEKFLDTPVKRYSSGMYVRLAFAVAAHLEPDILIVDEVLAVGDAQFQTKCLGKMQDVSEKEGRTVLFVSHNLGMVQTLCRRGILLGQGRILSDGPISEAVSTYLQLLEQSSSQDLLARTDRYGNGRVRLARIDISMGGNTSSLTLVTGCPAIFTFHTTGIFPGLTCCFTIYDQKGQPITCFDSAILSQEDVVHPEKLSQFICKIDELLLVPGRYRINASLMCGEAFEDDVKAALFFEVEEGTIRGRPVFREDGYGSVQLQHCWITPL
jgi:lipopolysaccharide transport system ATP-binding protein